MPCHADRPNVFVSNFSVRMEGRTLALVAGAGTFSSLVATLFSEALRSPTVCEIPPHPTLPFDREGWDFWTGCSLASCGDASRGLA